VIEGFEAYLGVPGCVLGVPPTATGRVIPIIAPLNSALIGWPSQRWPNLNGLAVRIPHTKDNGAFWMRVVLEFLMRAAHFPFV